MPKARFVMCKGCGKHGNFMFPDGSKSDPVFSKEVARIMLRMFVLQGHILKEDELDVLSDINNTALVEKHSAMKRHDAIAFLLGRVSLPFSLS